LFTGAVFAAGYFKFAAVAVRRDRAASAAESLEQVGSRQRVIAWMLRLLLWRCRCVARFIKFLSSSVVTLRYSVSNI